MLIFNDAVYISYPTFKLYRLLEWLVKHSSKKDLKGMFEEPKEPYVRDVKIGRNDPCPCGSGKKYKKCCGRFL